MLAAPPSVEQGAARPSPREPLGRVISVTGAEARIGLTGVCKAGQEPRATVGKFLGVRSGRSLLIGMITEVSALPPATAREVGYHTVAHLDLMGEIKEGSHVKVDVEGRKLVFRPTFHEPAVRGDSGRAKNSNLSC